MKKYFKISSIIFVFYIVLYVLIYIMGNWLNYKEIILDNEISIEIQRTNGAVEKITGNKFIQTNTDDRLIVTIPIPENIEFDYPTLCFTTFSSITKIWYEDTLLYSFGEEIEKQGKMIGTLYDSVILPQEVRGKTIIMECIATERGSMNQISNVMLVDAKESSNYTIISNLPNLIIFLTIFVISVAVYLIFLFIDKKDYITKAGVWLTQIIAVMSLYILTSQGLLHPLVNDFRLLTNLEYISIFFIPIPFALFFHDIYENKILKKIIRCILCISIIFFVVCTILNYSTYNYHYVYFLPYLHGEIIVAVLIYCIGIFIKTEDEEQEEWIGLVKIGLIVLLIFSMIEVIRFNLAKKSESIFFNLKLLPIGVVIVLSVLTMGMVLRMLKRFQIMEEQKQLEKLAYYDILTGLETRVKCYALIENIKRENIWEYTIFYIDLNDLKYYNDKFGHYMGDEYIKTMAQIMRKTFSEADTISRFGGDEFVVLYLRNIEDKIEEYIHRFNESIKECNEKNLYPFTINAACGVVSSTKEAPLGIEAAIAIADHKMYEDKKRQKKERMGF